MCEEPALYHLKPEEPASTAHEHHYHHVVIGDKGGHPLVGKHGRWHE